MPPFLRHPAFARLAARVEEWTAPPAPGLALEIAASSLRLARRGATSAAPERVEERPLPPGLVVPSAVHPNVGDAAALVRALRSLLAGAAGPLVLLVPDLTARVAVLDFETLPARRDELEPLARFRLRKSLPFADAQAAFSCQVLGPTRLLVAVADRRRLDEYEDCLEQAGAAAAAVLPSTLAALAALPALGHAALLLRCDDTALTSAFCLDQRIEFFRALELAAPPSLDDLFPSIAFYRDRCESAYAASAAFEPLLIAAGLPAALETQLRAEVPWAHLRTAETPGHLPVLGALRGQFA